MLLAPKLTSVSLSVRSSTLLDNLNYTYTHTHLQCLRSECGSSWAETERKLPYLFRNQVCRFCVAPVIRTERCTRAFYTVDYAERIVELAQRIPNKPQVRHSYSKTTIRSRRNYIGTVVIVIVIVLVRFFFKNTDRVWTSELTMWMIHRQYTPYVIRFANNAVRKPINLVELQIWSKCLCHPWICNGRDDLKQERSNLYSIAAKANIVRYSNCDLNNIICCKKSSKVFKHCAKDKSK